MIGAKGFRAREATANYKRRDRRLVSDEVRAARFAILFGNDVGDDEDEVETVVAVEAEQDEKPAETQAEETTEGTKEVDAGEGADGDAAAAEADAAEKAAGEKPAAAKPGKPASKKKANKAAT
ncbi:hypothetical protein J4G48_0040270 [Bradyrhizobium barranii subsp. apii]|uniref:hypothetical protein n=1 Tax=Bradyrhizobium barranii TaxID=2992140 RepID=UPI001AA12CFE|nr:hypothetical protein [Bradyrhizobium barranii]UPT95394.1 hypothetical protein J4G48_0040270 [Bradyrhizobium barranii subsp. apii]